MDREPSNASLRLVDEKRVEMGFFLVRLAESGTDELAFRCFFSAFASAARSVLYALESARRRIDPGFEQWFEPRREQVARDDPITAYVLLRRDGSVHVGETGVRSMRIRRGDDGAPVYEFFFAIDPRKPEPISIDVVSACEHTHNAICDLVDAAHDAFPHAAWDYLLDPAVVAREGLSVEDVEERLGFPRGWSYVRGASLADRLSALRYGRPPVIGHPAFERLRERAANSHSHSTRSSATARS